ncbi:MAG: CHAT domain-containing protein [Thermoanaerobaculia bacterium]
MVGSPQLQGSALALSLPRLARSAAGQESIAALYREAVVLQGPDASREALAGLGGPVDVLQLDVHAVGTPSGPALVLAGEEGLLGTGDIGPQLLHGARLVVLGACATAAGPRDPLEGPMGLARAFLGAGAGTVIATLWPVVDEDVSAILPRIHRHLAAGERPAAAFREALLEGIPAATDDGALGDWAGLQLVSADAGS